MLEIAKVNWMYNSSLSQFLELYNKSIDKSPKTALPLKDVENITSSLTEIVYRYVNRGLFERDKITFLLMVCFKILITDGQLTSSDISILLKAGNSLDKADMKKKPSPDWINQKMWNNLTALSMHCFGSDNTMPFFKNLPEQISNNLDEWKKWAYEKSDPENHKIPEFEEKIQNDIEIGSFLRFCLIRCFREDRTITACTAFIENTLKSKTFT